MLPEVIPAMLDTLRILPRDRGGGAGRRSGVARFPVDKISDQQREEHSSGGKRILRVPEAAAKGGYHDWTKGGASGAPRRSVSAEVGVIAGVCPATRRTSGRKPWHASPKTSRRITGRSPDRRLGRTCRPGRWPGARPAGGPTSEPAVGIRNPCDRQLRDARHRKAPDRGSDALMSAIRGNINCDCRMGIVDPPSAGRQVGGA